MIDDFLEEQAIACKIFKNSINKNKYSHAYLFETNGYYAKDLIVLAFVKSLLCPNSYYNNTNCSNCNQCLQIDSNVFPDVVHIYPDGLWIKKEQLQELQHAFETKSVQANKKVYIIHEADKMNVQASNSILKFLEEPEENIIAILMTDNIYQLLDTIISRCQIISLRNIKKNNFNIIDVIKNNLIIPDDIDEESLSGMVDLAINFITTYEKKKIDILLTIQKNFINNVSDKESLIFVFDTIILFYIDIIHYISNGTIEIFKDKNEEIDFISKKNNLNSLNYKINKFMELKKLIKNNVNTNLLLDKLIIELERSDSFE